MKRWMYGCMIAGSLCLAAVVIGSKLSHSADTQFLYLDFDISMETDKHQDKFTEAWGKPLMQVLKTLYARNNVRNVPYDAHCKIPKIIHQVWLGSPFPEKYRAWQQSWKDFHPDWEYKLWTDADIDYLLSLGDFFVGDTYRYYTEATNYGERSDVLKILLIYYFGGMYVDTDYEALRSLEILHHYYDCYIGIQPLDVAYAQLGYALFAASPRHPLLKKVVEMLAVKRNEKMTVMRTGPLMITECFYHFCLSSPGRVIALPASYFYPRGYLDPIEPRNKWMKKEAFAAHHWEGSWLAPQAQIEVRL